MIFGHVCTALNILSVVMGSNLSETIAKVSKLSKVMEAIKLKVERVGLGNWVQLDPWP